ncbi:YraN family protein [Bartonella sp. TP]|uniref:YraN family protein n=1 Tax=Bartonella sp. TP TaxID=3057550 RepID=UPI0025B26560|nr:YraN family protein [Bartonella sp. TP]MDN5249111.1 YraN family protein [Alphaproteobacteria bacterium]WJW79682.1 YraN family protein [Bartonella sp. TP]
MFLWRPYQSLTTYEKGWRAENYAAWYLRFKGFRILDRRYKTPRGEVDIIAKRGKLLIIVEVKARNELEEALNAVTRKAAKRIVAAASHWLSRRKNIEKCNLRFDVIVICPNKLPIHIVNYYLL